MSPWGQPREFPFVNPFCPSSGAAERPPGTMPSTAQRIPSQLSEWFAVLRCLGSPKPASSSSSSVSSWVSDGTAVSYARKGEVEASFPSAAGAAGVAVVASAGAALAFALASPEFPASEPPLALLSPAAASEVAELAGLNGGPELDGSSGLNAGDAAPALESPPEAGGSAGGLDAAGASAGGAALASFVVAALGLASAGAASPFVAEALALASAAGAGADGSAGGSLFIDAAVFASDAGGSALFVVAAVFACAFASVPPDEESPFAPPEEASLVAAVFAWAAPASDDEPSFEAPEPAPEPEPEPEVFSPSVAAPAPGYPAVFPKADGSAFPSGASVSFGSAKLFEKPLLLRRPELPDVHPARS